MKNGNKRLLKLAAFLMKVPEKALNMGSWVSHGTVGDRVKSFANLPLEDDRLFKRGDVRPGLNPKAAAECGFAACAVGWACSMPAFRRAGLRMELDNNCIGALIPTYKDEYAFNAVQKFFNMGEDAADDLFGPDRDATPKDVAKRIKRYVAADEGVKVSELPRV